MKNIISNSLKKLILIMFVLSINLTNLFAQANPKLQVIVMFEKNIITLPQGKTEADVNELKIKSSKVQEIFFINQNLETELGSRCYFFQVS